jgi:DMSO/TMAO reductase YedYZ molybdopterin-dependent catalytic subunit
MHEGEGSGAATAPAYGGMIVRQAEPVNLEMPFGTLDHFVTRTEDFFVRCHFAIPEISRDRWCLRVSGLVAQPLVLRWDELRTFPTTSLTATIECAGNGRVFLSPKVDGAQWERGAVGNAVWTGVPLQTLLARAGVKPGASELILIGSDHGEIEAAPKPGGKIHYARRSEKRSTMSCSPGG